MRILPVLLFALACSLSTLSAQDFGVRAGVNFTSLKIEADGVSLTYDAQTNLMLGVFLDLPVGSDKFMLSPELSYLGRGYNFNFDFLGNSSEIKANISYLDLGLLAKYKLVDNSALGVFIGAGPVLGYAMSGTSEVDGMKEDIEFDDEDGFNRTYLSLAFVGGVTFAEKFFVEGRYMLGLSSLNEEDTDVDSSKWNAIGLNAGVRIPLGN